MSKRIYNNNISTFHTERHKIQNTNLKKQKKVCNLQESKEFETKGKVQFHCNIMGSVAVAMM